MHQDEAEQCLFSMYAECATVSTEDSSTDIVLLPAWSMKMQPYGISVWFYWHALQYRKDRCHHLSKNGQDHTGNWTRKVPDHISQKEHMCLTPTKAFLIFAVNRLPLKQLVSIMVDMQENRSEWNVSVSFLESPCLCRTLPKSIFLWPTQNKFKNHSVKAGKIQIKIKGVWGKGKFRQAIFYIGSSDILLITVRSYKCKFY